MTYLLIHFLDVEPVHTVGHFNYPPKTFRATFMKVYPFELRDKS